MIKDVLRIGLILAIVCIIASGGLAGTYALTKNRIMKQTWEEQIKAVREVLKPIGATKFKPIDNLTKKAKKKNQILDRIFEGKKSDHLVGYCIQVLPRGYGGPIKIAVGLNLEGKIIGIKIVQHRETPGLGTAIEERSFQKKFIGKGEEDQFEVGKDIDAISGATISSRGVASGLKAAVEVFEQYLERR